MWDSFIEGGKEGRWVVDCGGLELRVGHLWNGERRGGWMVG